VLKEDDGESFLDKWDGDKKGAPNNSSRNGVNYARTASLYTGGHPEEICNRGVDTFNCDPRGWGV